MAKAIESSITGVISDIFGGFSAGIGAATGESTDPAGGVLLGLPVGMMFYVGSSLWLDEMFWPTFNEENLHFLGEWQNEKP